MNLGFLDKSSKITPLLVQLYDSQKAKSPESRPETSAKTSAQPLGKGGLLEAVCTLLDMDLSDRESELVADIMLGLLRQAELDMRQALAARLAVLDKVPLRLIIQMANDEISVANSILKQSSLLSDLDLVYIIKSKPSEYWESIAQRKAMSDQVINVLADTGDVETAIKLAENDNITLNEHALTVLSDMAQKNETLAQPLLRRDDVPTDLVQKLYQFVGEELKTFIEIQYGVTQGSIAEALDEMILEFVDATEDEQEFVPPSSMIKDAHRQKEKGLLSVKVMLGALRRGQIKPFVAQFAQYTGLDVSAVNEVLTQANGQGLAVACQAADIKKEDFISIYLLTNRIRNKGQMVELGDMGRAISYYSKITKEMACNIIQNSKLDNGE